MTKEEILQQTGLTEQEFYDQYPTADSYFKRGGAKKIKRKQMGGPGQQGQVSQEQEQLMMLIQAYAEANQIDPEELTQQLQEADPETQQEMLSQMMQEMQEMQQPQQQQSAFSTGEEYADMPEINPYPEQEQEQEMKFGGLPKAQDGDGIANVDDYINSLKYKPARISPVMKALRRTEDEAERLGLIVDDVSNRYPDIDRAYIKERLQGTPLRLQTKTGLEEGDYKTQENRRTDAYFRDMKPQYFPMQNPNYKPTYMYPSGYNTNGAGEDAEDRLEYKDGGPSKGGQAKTYMNKTSNFINWLKTQSQEANQQNMMDQMHMMPDGTMMRNDQMKFGGLPKAQDGTVEDYYKKMYIDAVKKYGTKGTDVLMKKRVNPGMYNQAQKFIPKWQNEYLQAFRDASKAEIAANKKKENAQSPTTTSTTTPTYTVTGNTVDNTDPNFQGDVKEENGATTSGGWTTYGEDDAKSTTDPDTDWKTKYENLVKQRGYYNQGYGYGPPQFNYGYPSFGGGLLNFIPNMIMALGSLGQMRKFNRDQPGLKGSPNNPKNTTIWNLRSDSTPTNNAEINAINRQNRQLSKKQQRLENQRIRQRDKPTGPVTSYSTSSPNNFKFPTAEQDIQRQKDEDAMMQLEKIKNRPRKFGGNLPKAQFGPPSFEPLDYYEPFEEEDYNYPMENSTWENPPTNSPAYTADMKNIWESGPIPRGLKSTGKDPEGKDLEGLNNNNYGFMMGYNPWGAQEDINTIQSLTSFANQAEQRKADRKARSEMSDITNKASDTNEINRGDWLGSSGAAYGMLRPDQNIYSGPYAFAKKGGTWFNNNFYQEGGEEMDYTEGDEVYMTDEEIQAFTNKGGILDFID